jgi:hypothetical protein
MRHLVSSAAHTLCLAGCLILMTACGSEPEPSPKEIAAVAEEKSWLEAEEAFSHTKGTNIFRPTEAEAEAIKQTIRGFLSARSVEDLAPLISEPDRVLPKVKTYYLTNSFISGGVYVNPQFRSAGKYIVTKVTLGGGSSERLLALEKADSGYKVNWELFIREIP